MIIKRTNLLKHNGLLLNLCLCMLISLSVLSAGSYKENFHNLNHIDSYENIRIENQVKLSYTNGLTCADGRTFGYENVSQTPGNSQNFELLINKYGTVFLIWQDDTPGNNDIFVSHWNGHAWSGMKNFWQRYDNVSDNAGTSLIPKSVLLNDISPAVFWYDETVARPNIFFTKWNTFYWSRIDKNPGYDNVSNRLDVTTYPKFNIALDWNGDPRVVFQRQEWSGGGNIDIYAARPLADGSWSTWNTPSLRGWSKSPNMIINPGNKDHYVTWIESPSWGNPISFYLVFSLYKDPGSWVHADRVTANSEDVLQYCGLTGSGDDFSAPVIKFNDLNQPYLFYISHTAPYTYSFIKWNSSTWTRIDNSTAGAETLATFNPPASFVRENSADFIMDSEYNPYIVCPQNSVDTSKSYIKFLRGYNNQWSRADLTAGYNIVSGSNHKALYPKIVLNNNLPYVIWEEDWNNQAKREIFFSCWNGTNWVRSDRKTPGSQQISGNTNFLSTNPKIIFFNNDPYFAWIDTENGNNDICFSKYSSVIYTTNGTIQSKKINQDPEEIENAKLKVSEQLNGQTIYYYLSRDGGSNWDRVYNNKLFLFKNDPVIKNDLRWKAILLSEAADKSPIILSLQIEYNIEDAVTKTGEILCYPSPFNVKNAVHGLLKFVNLPRTAELRITTLQGRIIKTFPKGSVKLLPYNDYNGISWDGCDETGKQLSTGLYIYIIEDDNKIIKRDKLLLINE